MAGNTKQYWTEVRVVTTPEAAEMVAEVLENLGCHGVEFHDPNLILDRSHWNYADFVSEQLSEQTGGEYSLSGYLPVDDRLEEGLNKLRNGIDHLRAFLPIGSGEITLKRVAEEEWADAWKAYFHPEIIDRVVICPSWETYQPGPDQVVVDLDPGMAFGTGTHPSTRLCLELLQEHLQPGDHLLDVGTGSGILAIAGAKLGAARVKAVDIDAVAVRVAAENRERNNAEIVEVVQGDLLSAVGEERFDLVMANIIASVIAVMMPDIPKVLRPGGRLIAAGIIDTRAAEVREAVEKAGLRIEAERRSGEWVAYLVKG